MVKSICKSVLSKAGYSISRLQKEPKHRESELKFIPNEQDRFRWFTEIGFGTILDVGAHKGESARHFRSTFPNAWIHSFEPLGDCFAELKSSMQSDPRHRAYHMAIGDEPGSVQMHRSAFSQSSSLLPMAQVHKDLYPFSSDGTMENVAVSSIDVVAENIPLDGKVLLKIDTQGYESKVLAGAAKTLAKIDMVVVETTFVALYEGQPLFPEIYRMMGERSFQYVGAMEQYYDPRDGRPIYQDAIFCPRA